MISEGLRKKFPYFCCDFMMVFEIRFRFVRLKLHMEILYVCYMFTQNATIHFCFLKALCGLQAPSIRT